MVRGPQIEQDEVLSDGTLKTYVVQLASRKEMVRADAVKRRDDSLTFTADGMVVARYALGVVSFGVKPESGN
ncbi:MAG: hypothetical protein OXP66_06190 [Candidatus Tectomicrobia bacterium]|nr:hypothetical protein [Candidatus Tectomicrobia bacterium]